VSFVSGVRGLVTSTLLIAVLPAAARAQGETLVLRGATVHTAVGPVLRDATIVIENGKIAAVGGRGTVRMPAGARVIDLAGKHIVPGFIDNHSHVGRKAGGRQGAAFRMIDHLDMSDPKWRIALSGGVTTVVTGPSGGNGIGGEAVVIKTFGPSLEQRVLLENGGMKLAAGRREPESGMAVIAMLRDTFQRAREYDARRGTAAPDSGLEAFARLLRHEDYVRVHVNAAQDIMAMLQLKDEFGFDLSLHHAVEAYQVADEIAKRGVDVVTLPLFLRIPISEEGMSNATRLSRAGVRVAFHQDDPVTSTKWLRFNGGLAMRYGLPETIALAGLTVDAARIARVANRVGSIEVGKDADLVVLDGPWYELLTRVDLVFVDGVVAYDRSREDK
jgi:imidazolonepropionase-like amidohydrolase